MQSGNKDKDVRWFNILSSLLIGIAVGLLIVCTGFWVYGQYKANVAIRMAGEAIYDVATTVGNPQHKIDYTGAITYLENAQQAYSENSMVRLTSVIYMVASTIILGYGAKMLRLGGDDKRELIAELFERTKQQLDSSRVTYEESIAQTKEQILNDFNYASILLNSSGNTLHLCLLLQSGLEMLPLIKKRRQRDGYINTLEHMQMEMVRSLQMFLDYMSALDNSNLPVDSNLRDMIDRNVFLLRKSFNVFFSTMKPEQINDDKTIDRLLRKCEKLCGHHEP